MSNMNVKLLVVSSLNSGKTIEIAGNSCICFGRNERADWSCNDAYMNGRHFEVENFGNRAMIRDCQSNGGTWLNNTVIVGETELTEGDEIRAGRTRFTVLFFSNGDS